MEELYDQGLSPRVRGNPGYRLGQRADLGSIPACAGEPPSTTQQPVSVSVYPRVCGGTVDNPACQHCLQGLSPRVRGNLITPARYRVMSRSIPACAGEPRAARRSVRRPRVYPRVCGGTQTGFGENDAGRGLSPRVRGNPNCGRRSRTCYRSIPACAGEPLRSVASTPDTAVYPRVCGGTSRAASR